MLFIVLRNLDLTYPKSNLNFSLWVHHLIPDLWTKTSWPRKSGIQPGSASYIVLCLILLVFISLGIIRYIHPYSAGLLYDLWGLYQNLL